jgi:hypothetical protein
VVSAAHTVAVAAVVVAAVAAVAAAAIEPLKFCGPQL